MAALERRKPRESLIPAQMLYNENDGSMYIMTKNSGKLSNFEALYEMEKGNIYLTDFNLGNAPLSLQQAFHRLIPEETPIRLAGKDSCAQFTQYNVNHYIVYQYLRNRGFHVFNNGPDSNPTIAHSLRPSFAQLIHVYASNVISYLSSFKTWVIFSWNKTFGLQWSPPLTRLQNHSSSESVENSIRIMKEKSRFEGTRNSFAFPLLSVYKPSSRFKKSQRVQPDFNVLVLNVDDNLSYEHIYKGSHASPLRLAIVSGKSVSFLSVLD